jgi:hypothetical protein
LPDPGQHAAQFSPKDLATVTRVGITGHRGLNAAATALIDAAIRSALQDRAGADLVGVTCLADGADTIFALAVLDQSGTIEVIIPAARYRDGLPPNTTPPTTSCWRRPVRYTAWTPGTPTPRPTWQPANS